MLRESGRGRTPASSLLPFLQPLRSALRSDGARFPFPMAPPRLGFLLFLACCFSCSEAQLLDWVWDSTKSTGSPAAPGEGILASDPPTSEAAPAPRPSPGTWGGEVVGNVTTPRRQEPDPATAAPVGEGTAAKTMEQWDRNATGLLESTAWPSSAPPHSMSPAPGQQVASSATKDPQLLGTGTHKELQLPGLGNSEDPQFLGTGNTEDPQLLGSETSKDPQLLWSGTTKDPWLLGTGTTEHLQLMRMRTTKDPQFLESVTSKNPQLLGTRTTEDLQLLGSGTTENPQLLRMGTTEDSQLLGSGTSKEPQLLGSGTTEDLQLLELGTTEDPQLLGMMSTTDLQLLVTEHTKDPQLLRTWTTEDPQLLGTGTTEDPQLPGMGTTENLQLLVMRNTEDTQLLRTVTTENPELLGTETPTVMETQVSLQRPAGPQPGSARFPFSPGDSTPEQVVPFRSPSAPPPHHLHGASPNLWHGTSHPGLALASRNGSQSPPWPDQRVDKGVDPPAADNSVPLEFDLLTATMQLYGSGGAGLASFLPGLMPVAGRCQPIPTHLPFCSVLGTSHVRLPNYLRHSSEEEIRAALHEWEGLLESRCHRYLEWFLCLLLLPGCSPWVPVTPPPCQGFCEAVRDLCWTHLAGGRLPLPCDALPEEDDGVSCVFINASAGNVAGRRPCAVSPLPRLPQALGNASALCPWDAAESKIAFHPVLAFANRTSRFVCSLHKAEHRSR